MAIRDDLLSFVRQALERGIARPEIRAVLLEAGWRAEDVDAGLALFAESAFPIPVPRPKPYLSARETFFHLLQFTALYVSTFNLGRLLFAFVDRAFPDPARVEYGADPGDAMRWSIASLVIAFPIFLLVSRAVTRAAATDPERRGSKIRKWLTYMTLFLAAGVLAGDLVTLVYNLLGGELTSRFLLKVATVAALAGGVFGYFLWDLRGEEQEAE